MKSYLFKILGLAVALVTAAVVVACNQDDAQVASRNISKASDNFEVLRRVVFVNGITDKYILSVEGLCSIEKNVGKNQLAVTCKTGPGEFKKHYLGQSDNVFYFVEQLKNVKASVYFYRVTFKPTTILPDIDIRLPGSTHEKQ